jgi:hypothetical protein
MCKPISDILRVIYVQPRPLPITLISFCSGGSSNDCTLAFRMVSIPSIGNYQPISRKMVMYITTESIRLRDLYPPVVHDLYSSHGYIAELF